MKTTFLATTLLVLSFTTLAGLAGCHADPQDTHIRTGVSPPG